MKLLSKSKMAGAPFWFAVLHETQAEPRFSSLRAALCGCQWSVPSDGKGGGWRESHTLPGFKWESGAVATSSSVVCGCTTHWGRSDSLPKKNLARGQKHFFLGPPFTGTLHSSNMRHDRLGRACNNGRSNLKSLKGWPGARRGLMS